MKSRRLVNSAAGVVEVMTIRQARIDSYFTFPTDLAAEMRVWPEFEFGEGYDVEFNSAAEHVTVKLVSETDEDSRYVLVRGTGLGSLFHRVLGSVAFAMAAHSDYVMVMRWRDLENQSGAEQIVGPERS
jgi:hypothetical protein